MAFPPFALDVIKKVLDDPSSTLRNLDRKIKVLSLGYPDILAERKTLAPIFGQKFVDQLKIREDSESIINWHSLQDHLTEIPDSYQFFDLLGCELVVVDIVESRGDEIILDLNEPMPEEYKGQFDMVVDSGTIEHCFNIAQAIKNVAEMINEGGYIVQGNPLSWYNHGFYNLNPTFYHDFYEANGFQVLWHVGVINSVLNPQTFDLPPYERFGNVPDNATNFLVVQRKSIQDIVWPIQKKYQLNPELKK